MVYNSYNSNGTIRRDMAYSPLQHTRQPLEVTWYTVRYNTHDTLIRDMVHSRYTIQHMLEMTQPTTTHNTQHTTHNTQHTTHNTQHTTHNTQHTTHNTYHITNSTRHTAKCGVTWYTTSYDTETLLHVTWLIRQYNPPTVHSTLLRSR